MDLPHLALRLDHRRACLSDALCLVPAGADCGLKGEVGAVGGVAQFRGVEVALSRFGDVPPMALQRRHVLRTEPPLQGSPN